MNGLTIDQAADRLGVSTRTVRAWVKSGRLIAQGGGQGRALRFTSADVELLADTANAIARFATGLASGRIHKRASGWFIERQAPPADRSLPISWNTAKAEDLARLPVPDAVLSEWARKVASKLTHREARYLTAVMYVAAHPAGTVRQLPRLADVRRAGRFWHAVGERARSLPTMAGRALVVRAQTAVEDAARSLVAGDYGPARRRLVAIMREVGTPAGMVRSVVAGWRLQNQRPCIPSAADVGRLLGIGRWQAAALWRSIRRRIGAHSQEGATLAGLFDGIG